MVVKLYISGISGNKEVKKKQQRVQMILDSKQISYEAIDITEPGKEKDKEFMQQNGKVRESLGKYPLPPQIFNDDNFCGDYEDFDLANEVDELEKFLHIQTKDLENGSKVNGIKEEFIGEKKVIEMNLNNEENEEILKVGQDESAIENTSSDVNEVKDDMCADSNPTETNEVEEGDAEELKDQEVPDLKIEENERTEEPQQVDNENSAEENGMDEEPSEGKKEQDE